MTAKQAYSDANPKLALPCLPRELWMDIIGFAVATELTSVGFLVSCAFKEVLPKQKQLNLLRKNMKFRYRIIRVCRDWYQLGRHHLFEFLIIRNDQQIGRLQKLFNEFNELAAAGGQGILPLSTSPVRLDIEQRSHGTRMNVETLLPYLSNLKIAFLHYNNNTSADLPNTFFNLMVPSCGMSLQYFDWPYPHWKAILEQFPFLHSIDTTLWRRMTEMRMFHAPNLQLLRCEDNEVLEELSDIFRGRNQNSQSSPNSNVTPFPALRQLVVPAAATLDIINPVLRHTGSALTEVRLLWVNAIEQFYLENHLRALSSFCPNLYRLAFTLFHWQYFPCYAKIVLPDSVVSLALHCLDSQTTKGGYDVLILGLERISAKGLKNVEFDSRNVHDLKKNHARRWQRIISTVKARGWYVWVYDAYGIEEVNQEV